jgi:hypothetical protein
MSVHAATNHPSSGGSFNGGLAAVVAGHRLWAAHAPSNTAAHAATRNSIPPGGTAMGLAMSGRPPKMHQNPAKNAAGEYQLPPDLRAANAIAGNTRKMAAVSQFTMAILSSSR